MVVRRNSNYFTFSLHIFGDLKFCLYIPNVKKNKGKKGKVMMYTYDQNKNTFLTKEQIREIAPSVFTEKANKASTSKHYVHIPTEKVIDDMSALGWGVVDAKQIQARKLKGYQKHMVVFGNDNLVIEGKDGDTVMPRILMTNSHDGKNAFRFQAGLYRLVCSNGLVIADAEFASLKIRHMGYDLG
jgi:hypothetical protein